MRGNEFFLLDEVLNVLLIPFTTMIMDCLELEDVKGEFLVFTKEFLSKLDAQSTTRMT
jgi:hypothetical protein